MSKRVVILGSTGSVGENALRVIAEHGDRCEVIGLAVGSNIGRLHEQIAAWHPRHVAVWDAAQAAQLRHWLGPNATVDVLVGAEGLQALASCDDGDVVVAAMSGVHGLQPLLAALAAGKTVAVANKESLVMAGELVMSTLRRVAGARLIPVDSEHSALFQCLETIPRASIDRLYITGSGGPLNDSAPGALATVGQADVLNHPRWKMGPKITVDSATLMNKGLELIEAHWLFDMPLDRLTVLIHPEAAIHGMVELIDGTLLSLMASCDMRLPLQHAISYPERWSSTAPRLAWQQPQTWHFAPPNLEKFPCLRLAMAAAQQGGTMPAVLNAANEVAVHAFLGDRITFLDIPRLIETVLAEATPHPAAALTDVLRADAWARTATEQLIAPQRIQTTAPVESSA